MAIFLTGDIHGTLEIGKVVEYFDEDALTEECTKEDSYLIILGDCGAVWDGGDRDRELREILNRLPVTTLYVDGNHENFGLLNEYPEVEWNGGLVHMVEENIIHLMRGQIYEICGLRFFAFGGANSVDKAYRTPGVSWWPEEMPSEAEYEEGIRNLERASYEVDYILTHTCPREVAAEMLTDYHSGEQDLQQYLQRIAEWCSFEGWYFGHFHCDHDVENFHCLYDEIVQLV